jgi:hypothetical protein
MERVAVANLSAPAFAQAQGAQGGATLFFEPTRTGVLSWNTLAPKGRIAFRLLRAHQTDGDWLDHSEWQSDAATSLSPAHAGTNVDVDVISALQPFDGIEVRAPGVRFELLAFSAPVHSRPSLPYARDAFILDVPARSQYPSTNPTKAERGLCSPASLSMIHAYHGIDLPLERAALGVFDRAYNGTGNWAFNVAYSGRLGFRAVVAHLRNLDHAQRLIERNLPLAISYSWGPGELPGAPLPHSDGHLAVLCGFTRGGDCAINDPAAPNVRVVYPRAAIEQIWQRNDGIAYVVAPVGVEFADVLGGAL